MTDERITFGDFEFPRTAGLEYLTNENLLPTDYLFVNEPRDSFSMYFEDGFPLFQPPEKSEDPYWLFEVNRPDRKIRFFCPEKSGNAKTAIWYFCLEMLDGEGVLHLLPGQIRVELNWLRLGISSQKPKFIEVLENVRLKPSGAIA
ncbi:MAG: hypothetical protein II297_03570 [Clostridia bacterium]|nr:hypothetical protein [Clostridia bacterium]